jgi:hypothetical protein
MFAALQGLDVVFEALLGMRQAHAFAFGKSDLFLLCAARLDASKQHALDESGRPRIIKCETVCSEDPCEGVHPWRVTPWLASCI